MPCVGQGVTFELSHAYLAYNNLDGQGPGSSSSNTMRFVNVGVYYSADGTKSHFDLEIGIAPGSPSYTPTNINQNGFNSNQKFAQINLECGFSVDLRAYLRLSCASAPSCRACEDSALTPDSRIACYAAGCAFFDLLVLASSDKV